VTPRAPRAARRALRLWAWRAKRAWVYRRGTRVAARGLWVMGGRKRRTGWIPMAGAWTKHRDMPTPQGGTFMAQWKGKRQLAPSSSASAEAAE